MWIQDNLSKMINSLNTNSGSTETVWLVHSRTHTSILIIKRPNIERKLSLYLSWSHVTSLGTIETSPYNTIRGHTLG